MAVSETFATYDKAMAALIEKLRPKIAEEITKSNAFYHAMKNQSANWGNSSQVTGPALDNAETGATVTISTTQDTTDWKEPFEWTQQDGSSIQADPYMPQSKEPWWPWQQPPPTGVLPTGTIPGTPPENWKDYIQKPAEEALDLQTWVEHIQAVAAKQEQQQALMESSPEPEKPKKGVPQVEPRRRRKICLPGRGV